MVEYSMIEVRPKRLKLTTHHIILSILGGNYSLNIYTFLSGSLATFTRLFQNKISLFHDEVNFSSSKRGYIYEQRLRSTFLTLPDIV